MSASTTIRIDTALYERLAALKDRRIAPDVSQTVLTNILLSRALDAVEEALAPTESALSACNKYLKVVA